MNTSPLHLEVGVTRRSLDNGKLLKELHGAVVTVTLGLDPKDWYLTYATYEDGYTHTFTGFSWGYSGEGSRGLAEWAADNDVPLTMETIRTLNNNAPVSDYRTKSVVATVWEWMRG